MDSIQNYLADIYESAGIPIKKGDPIMALHVFLQHFEEDFNQLMEDQRRQMISVLEQEQQKWQEQSRTRAELIIEKGLEAAQKHSHNIFEEQSALLCQKINEIFKVRMAELAVTESRLSLIGKINLLCMGGILVFLVSMLVF